MASNTDDGTEDERATQAAAILGLSPSAVLTFWRQQKSQTPDQSSLTFQRSSISDPVRTNSTAHTTPQRELQRNRPADEGFNAWAIPEQQSHDVSSFYDPGQIDYHTTFGISDWLEGLFPASDRPSAPIDIPNSTLSSSGLIFTIEDPNQQSIHASTQLPETIPVNNFAVSSHGHVPTVQTIATTADVGYGGISSLEYPSVSLLAETTLPGYDDTYVAQPVDINSTAQPTHGAQARPKLAPLAPKKPNRGGNKPTIRDQSSSAAIPRHRRKAYAEDKLKQTNKTRELASCARCKAQRRRCIPNPEGDHLPCLICLTTKAGPKYTSLGCIRSRLSDCQLFRTGVGFYTFYQKHPMIGSTYGDFHMQESRMWVRGELHILEITQDMGPVCRFEVRQFIPPVETDAVDLKGRSMYHVPWAIADADETTRAFNMFLDDSIVPYLKSVLVEGDELFEEVFTSALWIAYPNAPKLRNTLVHKTLRLWVACRFIEGKWRCCGPDVLRAGELKNPFRSPDWVSPPPYIDYQYASIIMHRILGPLSKAVLKELQDLVDKRKPRDWYTIFLVTFILLHNYERGILFQRVFWAKRRMTHMYHDMSHIRAIHHGAKTLLVNFHVSCRGNVPFGIKFDWNTEAARKMADIDQKQVDFLTKLGVLVRQKEEEMRIINQSHSYETPYWFTSQIFEEKWSVRSTLEHSPEAQPWPPRPVFGPVAPPG